MAHYASEAERLRAHREAFQLALQLGCTPREAAEQLRLEKAAQADREASSRLAAKSGNPLPPAISRAPEWDARWMHND